MCVVRFAPSPTGYIHIGNARTALFNWLFSNKAGGQFILRFDDTDRERSKTEYADSILEDLNWLGIVPDRIEYQSHRDKFYAAAVTKLKEKGLLYPCYETPEELEFRRKMRLSRHLPPVYGREALSLTENDKKKLLEEGKKPYWRFLLPNYSHNPFEPQRTFIEWEDLVRGHQSVDLSSLSDPVLVREDGTYLYTLPSVVDDCDFGITHVLRGDDHVTNTAVQIALLKGLDAQIPIFGHHNLLSSLSGETLSKRNHVASLKNFREEGIEPMVLASLAVLSGTSENVIAMHSMKDLEKNFDPSFFGRSSAKFDSKDLKMLNCSYFQTLPFETIKARLERLIGFDSRMERFWYAICGNIEFFSDVLSWWRIIFEKLPVTPEFSDDEKQFLRLAFSKLPPEPWNQNSVKEWLDRVIECSGRKGKSLYSPLRRAITGHDSGPELKDLFFLMGREALLSRCP